MLSSAPQTAEQPPNRFAARQNDKNQIRHLQAARQLYTDVKRLLILQLSISVLIPVAAAATLLFVNDPTLKAFLAIVSIIFTLVDVSVIDSRQRRSIEDAAKAQEVFDCAVFELPWDEVLVGARAEPEVLQEAYARYDRQRGTRGLRDWYPTELGQLPIHLARLQCQRSALVYDSGLRRPYASAVLFLAGGVFCCLLAIALLAEASLTEMALSVFIPAAPLISWALRDHRRHSDAADANDKLKKVVDALHSRAEAGGCSEAECGVQARLVQSEVFRLRKSKPPIFNWVYRLNRARLERRMRAVAGQLVQRLNAPQEDEAHEAA